MSWRLPTKEEWEELREKCTWEWTTQNDVNGYKVTAENGNFIFLPNAGYRLGSPVIYGASGFGYYWSCSLINSDSDYAWCCYFGSCFRWIDHGHISYSKSVRPVSYNKSQGIDLGLSVNWCEHNWRNSADTDIRIGDYYTYDEAIKLFQNQNNKNMDKPEVAPIDKLSSTYLTKQAIPTPNRLRPNYYKINGIECKDVIGEFNYNIGAAMKYLWRHGRKTEEGMSDKDKAVEDLRKAIEHIEFEIQRLGK